MVFSTLGLIQQQPVSVNNENDHKHDCDAHEPGQTFCRQKWT
jgi:hypothetical protein